MLKLVLLIPFLSMIMIKGCHSSRENREGEFPPVTPYWALGHIVWEDNVNTQHGADSLIRGYLDHNIPVDGIIIDSPWELHYNDFVWDPAKYPNPDLMLGNFMKKGVRTLLWMTGNINKTATDIPNQKSPDLDYVIEKNYVISVNDSVIFPWWKGDGVFIDFPNPEAVKWWNKQLDKAFRYGVYGWKVDNFRLPEGTDSLQTSAGTLSARDFKRYYYDNMYDYTVSRNPEGIILARPYSYQGGYNASVSKLSVGWSGDFTGDWKGLKFQIENIYKSAVSGYGALACEIGGFSGTASNNEQFVRYAQFASMVATMDNGGANGAFLNHLPWYHGKKAADIYRNLIVMHRALRPYIFSYIVKQHLTGSHLINNLSVEQKSHMLGDDLFVKAITSDTNRVTFKIPGNDIWYDVWTGKSYVGGESITKTYSLNRFPLFIRKGAVIPLDMTNVYNPRYKKFEGKKVILIYAPDNREIKCHLPAGDGTEYDDILLSINVAGMIRVRAKKEHEFVFLIKKAGHSLISLSPYCSFDVITGAKIIEKKGKEFNISLNKKY